MQGPRRKLFHATLYELIAILIVTVALAPLSEHGAAHAGVLALLTSGIAMSWNVAFNTLFEAWERRQTHRSRTVRRRALHALGFELGLLLMTLPLIAWWLDLSWWHALVTDLGLMVFFLAYTFCFNWLFDRVFGLPDSASS
jgi:uncharacterized membrane protein